MKLFEIEERSVLSVMGQQPLHHPSNFDCSEERLTSLVGCPQTVKRHFNCRANYLTSLVGGPQSVGGVYDCTDNKLVSLEGAPQIIGGNFFCDTNKIQSLHNVHLIIKQIKGDFWCDFATHMLGIALIKGVNKVNIMAHDDTPAIQEKAAKADEIFNRYLRDVHMLQDALIDAGLREQAQI